MLLPMCILFCVFLCYDSVVTALEVNVTINNYIIPIINKTDEEIKEEAWKKKDSEYEGLKQQLQKINHEINQIKITYN